MYIFSWQNKTKPNCQQNLNNNIEIYKNGYNYCAELFKLKMMDDACDWVCSEMCDHNDVTVRWLILKYTSASVKLLEVNK